MHTAQQKDEAEAGKPGITTVGTLQQWWPLDVVRPQDDVEVWVRRSGGEVEKRLHFGGRFWVHPGLSRSDVTHWCYVQPPLFEPDDPNSPVALLNRLLAAVSGADLSCLGGEAADALLKLADLRSVIGGDPG